MLIHFYRLSYFIFILFQITNVSAANTENKIAILVNDNVITNYDIEQRVKFFSLSNKIQITPENSVAITNKIIDELIDDILKNEKVLEYKIKVKDKDLYEFQEIYIKNRGFENANFLSLMSLNNISTDTFDQIIKTDLSWQILINRLYFRTTSVSELEIDELIKKDQSLSPDIAEKMVMDKQLALRSNKLLRDLRSEATIEYK